MRQNQIAESRLDATALAVLCIQITT